MKKIFNIWLMAALTVGLSMSVTSCKDDDDNNNNEQKESQDSATGMSELQDDQLRDLICQWCDVQKDELYGSDWKQHTYEPTEGDVLDASTPLVRSIQADTQEEADKYAVSCLNTLGIDYEKPSGFRYSDAAVGTVEYNHSTEPNTFATIDVDIRQMPALRQIRLVKELPHNANDKPYYQVGDIIKYKNRNYVCATEHGYKEKAVFVTFNDQEDHTTGTFRWSGYGNDVVYNDDMASAEAVAEWIANVLLVDNTWEMVKDRMKAVGAEAETRQVVPENKEARNTFVRMLYDFELVQPEGQFYKMEGYIWEEHEDYAIIALNQRLLANKVRWSQHAFSSWDQWVPYIVVMTQDNFYKLYFTLRETPSMETLDPSHFKWTRLKAGEVDEYSTLQQHGDFKKGVFNICLMAMHWKHEGFIRMGDEDHYLFDFTKDYKNHPRKYIREDAEKIPGDWTSRCVTSRELTFTDNGNKQNKYESVYVKREHPVNH